MPSKPIISVLLLCIIMAGLLSVVISSSIDSPEEYFDVKILINAKYIGGNVIGLDIRFEFINKFAEPVRIRILKEPHISLIYGNNSKILAISCKNKVLNADAGTGTTYATAKLCLLINDVPDRLIIYGGLIEVISGNKSLANLTKIISYNTRTASSKILFSNTSIGGNKIIQPQVNYREILYKMRTSEQLSQPTITSSPQISIYEVVRIRSGENGNITHTSPRYNYTYVLEIIGTVFLLFTILVLYLLRSRFVQ